MQLYSKAFMVKRVKGRSLLESIQAFFSKNLAADEKPLRYFIFSAGRKSIKLEATILKE